MSREVYAKLVGTLVVELEISVTWMGASARLKSTPMGRVLEVQHLPEWANLVEVGCFRLVREAVLRAKVDLEVYQAKQRGWSLIRGQNLLVRTHVTLQVRQARTEKVIEGRKEDRSEGSQGRIGTLEGPPYWSCVDLVVTA